MTDRFRPCELTELADAVSLINDPHSPDISPRRQLPFSALIAANLQIRRLYWLDCRAGCVAALMRIAMPSASFI